METLNVVNELRAQLAQAEMDLANSSCPEDNKENYHIWMEQHLSVIQDLKHEIELFA